ncbi:MAG TPA: glycoside hydrolase family 2 [Anaerolineae bacterium]|nr:glycoside hydrolase family 2 [Anaerolineae bacterium]
MDFLRKRFVLVLIVLWIAAIDGIAWFFSWRAATAPSAEELAAAAGLVATPSAPTIVERKEDGMFKEVSLTGTWKYLQAGSEVVDSYYDPDYVDLGWHEMEIPNNWYLAGLNYHGIIWFRREFEVPETWRGRVVRLRFEGVDYFADVWLNGQPLGHHEGYFQPFQFDVADLLNYGGTNVLAVRVNSPYEEYGTVWHHHKTLIKGIFEHHDTRPGGGWGPAGQEYNTGGIWNDVLLQVSDYITVDDVKLTATSADGEMLHAGGDAHLKAELTLTNHADTSTDVTVEIALTPRNFEGANRYLVRSGAHLRRGRNSVVVEATIKQPALWWPWDRGHPNLYTVSIAVKEGDAVIATRELAFGFRQVSVDKDWHWMLNGERFFPRGSNYISTQWLAETLRPLPSEQDGPKVSPELVERSGSTEWFLRDVQMMRDANLNFIRVHAHVEPEAFYRATDELGILVWQDFPLQWEYTDAPAFHDEALRQMQDMIELLYNHPSIVVWCSHNESPWDAPWMADRVPHYDPSQNKRLDEQLTELARELDPTRYAHINSGTGDTHPYPGWYYGNWRDFVSAPQGPMPTEYGAQALPNLETIQRMFSPEVQRYDSGEARKRWEFHDFQERETFQIASIDRGDSIEDFIANSQAYQANLVQFATEAYRRKKYDGVQGIFQFMFVEDWPSITWAVVDYYRRPKAGYDALRVAMQPILPSIQAALPDDLDRRVWVYKSAAEFWANLWVINDTLQAYPGAILRWEIDGGDRSGEHTVDIEPDGVQEVVGLADLKLLPGEYTLRVVLTDASGQVLGQNELPFRVGENAE